jgi:hypothetical protein
MPVQVFVWLVSRGLGQKKVTAALVRRRISRNGLRPPASSLCELDNDVQARHGPPGFRAEDKRETGRKTPHSCVPPANAQVQSSKNQPERRKRQGWRCRQVRCRAGRSLGVVAMSALGRKILGAISQDPPIGRSLVLHPPSMRPSSLLGG